MVMDCSLSSLFLRDFCSYSSTQRLLQRSLLPSCYFFNLRGLCDSSQNLTVQQPCPPRSLILSYPHPCSLLVFQTFLTMPCSASSSCTFHSSAVLKKNLSCMKSYCPLSSSSTHWQTPASFPFLTGKSSAESPLSPYENPNSVKSRQAPHEHTGGN